MFFKAIQNLFLRQCSWCLRALYVANIRSNRAERVREYLVPEMGMLRVGITSWLVACHIGVDGVDSCVKPLLFRALAPAFALFP